MGMPVSTVSEYLKNIPADQKVAFEQLRKSVLSSLPEGLEECISYNMLWYVVPHSVYPAGYHCDPKLPLPFISIAYQKNSINLYHMWMHAKPEISERFQNERKKHSSRKLDMGKSCIRLKYYDDIPYILIEELIGKMSMKEWIDIYEKTDRS